MESINTLKEKLNNVKGYGRWRKGDRLDVCEIRQHKNFKVLYVKIDQDADIATVLRIIANHIEEIENDKGIDELLDVTIVRKN